MDYETLPLPKDSPAYTLDVIGFQSLHSFKMDFSGFTALTGATDSGKSAIVRALKAVLFNDMHPSYISSHLEECIISLTMHDHPIIREVVLHRNPKKNINKYRVRLADGTVEDHDKTGKTTPQIMQDHGIRIIETDRGQKINTNFQSQHDPVFMFSMTETEITDMYNALFGTNRIEKALLNVNKDVAQANRDYTDTLGNITTTETNLENSLNQAEQLRAQLRQLTLLREGFERANNLSVTATERRDAYYLAAQNIETAKGHIELARAELSVLDKIITALRARATASAAAESLKDAVTKLSAAMAAQQRATQQVGEIAKLILALRRRGAATATLRSLQSLTKPVAPDQVDEKNAAYAEAIKRIRLVGRATVASLNLQAIKPPEQTDTAVKAVGQIDIALQHLRKIGGTRHYQKQLQPILQEIENRAKQIEDANNQRATIIGYEQDVLNPNTGECNACGRRIPKVQFS